MDDNMHKMELLKALREHGQTIRKFADGGLAPTAPTAGPSALGGPSQSGAGSPSQTTGVLGGLNDFLGTQSNFVANGANIQQGTNANQLNAAYTGAQNGLTQQQNFLNALQAQNGIQNQSDVYNRMTAMANGQGPNPAQAMLNQQTGQNVANQAALMAGQRGASSNVGLMAREAAQQGAQTQQNAVGQGAALQAQQSQNATNNMANIAQNQINQQGQATTGLNTAQQNEQNILQGANTATNNANVGMQSNMNNVNAQISQGNQSAGNGLLGGVMQGASSIMSMFGAKGGEVASYEEGGEVDESANVGSENYTAPAADTSPNVGSPGTSIDEGASLKDAFSGGKSGGGGGGGGMGGLMSLAALANKGGMIQKYADGTPNAPVAPQPGNSGYSPYSAGPFTVQAPVMAAPAAATPAASGPKSNTGKALKGVSAAAPNIGSTTGNTGGGQYLQEGVAKGLSNFADALKNRQGNATNQTGEQAQEAYLDSDAYMNQLGGTTEQEQPAQQDANPNMENAAKGGQIGDKLKKGGKVPGKPKVPGKVNTEKNDTVPALLSAGEIVLPRSVTKSSDPAGNAAKFVASIMAKKGQLPGKRKAA